MPKTYNLSELEVADEQKTITISEVKQVTEEKKVSVAQLKAEHAACLADIAERQKRADAIVDMLTEIQSNLGLSIPDKPAKFKR